MKRTIAHILLMITAFIWGVTFVFQATGMETLGPFGFASFRFLAGSVAILPLAIWELRRTSLLAIIRNSDDIIKTSEVKFLIWGALGLGGILFLGSVLQQVSLGYTSVANTAFLTTLYVPLVPILGFLMFRRNINIWRWGAVGIFVIGSWMMTGASPKEAVVGDVMVVMGAVFWALHIMLVGAMVQRTNTPFQLAFIQTFITTILCFIALFAVETFTWDGVLHVLPEILFAGILSTGLGFTFQLVAQQHCSNAAAAIILSLEGVIAAFAGWYMLDQAMAAMAIVGAGLIFVAVLVVELTPEGPRLKPIAFKKKA